MNSLIGSVIRNPEVSGWQLLPEPDWNNLEEFNGVFDYDEFALVVDLVKEEDDLIYLKVVTAGGTGWLDFHLGNSRDKEIIEGLLHSAGIDVIT